MDDAIKPRVIDEKEQLESKIWRLHGFTKSEKFKTLPTDEQALMLQQLDVMRTYAEILQKRIDF